MRLRRRLTEDLKRRLTAHLPDALETVWTAADVVVAIESLKIASDGGDDGDGWGIVARIGGTLRAEIRADAIDALALEPLIADLAENPLLLPPDPATRPGDLSETVRATLIEVRDTVRDRDVTSALRFEAAGRIVRALARSASGARTVMLGFSPDTGPEHIDDYVEVKG